MSESGRGGACSVLCHRACSAQVPTVGKGELVMLRELFSIAELTDSCLEPQDRPPWRWRQTAGRTAEPSLTGPLITTPSESVLEGY